jgi:hypothetical protein
MAALRHKDVEECSTSADWLHERLCLRHNSESCQRAATASSEEWLRLSRLTLKCQLAADWLPEQQCLHLADPEAARTCGLPEEHETLTTVDLSGCKKLARLTAQREQQGLCRNFLSRRRECCRSQKLARVALNSLKGSYSPKKTCTDFELD